MPFDPSILEPAPSIRTPILAILDAALDAVDPFVATQRYMRRSQNILTVAQRVYDLNDYRRIFVVGAGKAGAPMVLAVEGLLGDKIAGGVVVVKTDHTAPTQYIELAEASHPMPDLAGVQAGKRILDLAESATQDDLVIVLLSGGGSALMVSPAEGITLDDLQAMTDALLASGATINEVNCLRKHCSAVKGGQLARALAPATVITLALSDVIGSPPDVIASGPTVPDQTTWADAWAIVQRYELQDKLPSSVLQRLQAGQADRLPDTPKPDDLLFHAAQIEIVADNRVAAAAACAEAKAQGYHTLLLTTYLQGEARDVAKVAVAIGLEIKHHNQPIPTPACVIAGGETTVTLGDNPGQGGRNQELVLAAALELDGIDGITVVSLATDGTDGPTDSAGGFADGRTQSRSQAASLDAEEHLRRHNAYPLLRATNDLLLSGPTHTNVNDLVFVFVANASATG